MTEPTTSPLPPTIKTEEIEPVEETMNELTFAEAIMRVTKGDRIHKLEWEDEQIFGYLLDGILTLHKTDGKNYHWVVSDGDLNGEDWVVLPKDFIIKTNK